MNQSPPGGSAGSELSDDLSHWSDYSGSDVTESTLAELLKRFTIEARPECTIKLRTQTGPVVVGADLTRVTAAGRNVGALVIKPSNPDQLWRRLRVDNSGTLTLRSRKLHWWVFTLDAIAHANPFSRTFDLSYRVATKWDITRGEVRSKRAWELGPQAEARAHWSLQYSLPAVEGSMGTASQRNVSREVHADVGYAHLDLPRLELVVWPRGRPEDKDAPNVSAAAAAGAEGGAEGGAAGGPAAAEAGAEARQGEAGEHWGSAAADSSSSVGGTAEAHGAAGAPAGGASEQQQQRRQWPGAGGGSSKAAEQRRKAAALLHLNSHVASLSGRWWDTFGSGGSGTESSSLGSSTAAPGRDRR